MILRKAHRKEAKIKMALQGVSGSGKTYSALLLAKGLVGSLDKVCVIDTENSSSDLYSHLGEFSVIPIDPPYTPEKYIQAIQIAEKEDMEVIIIDSLSHAWEYLIDYHSSLSGNSFTNWSKVTPRHNALITTILGSKAHVISCLRVKQDYVLSEKNGKMVPEKIGLKPIQRDGVDYEFTIVFELNYRHQVTATKDRTGLFMGLPEFIITESTSKQIAMWCNISVDIVQRINSVKSLKELTDLYKLNTDPASIELFTAKKAELSKITSNPIIIQNGKH